ncbi:hypothetical protein COLO4_14179 [Corchorus olitorius]|uniref:Eukaryotic rRNA processing n=1 Tax=Corchorus olitorius TaxID=93759 RepID=A0A1R3JTN5_9ROSI|nr:hypothetical protein COLO4_14179 [Corchorus olitorius]
MGRSSKQPTLLAEDTVEDDDVMDDLSEEESEFESDSVEEEEDVKLAEPAKNAIYNRDGLLEKLQDISWPENVDWMHKLSLDIDQEKEVDVNDDLARELAFYTQALEGTRVAFEKFQSMGLPFLRPPDYYAEMVKSDAHMQKVKGKLLAQKRQIEEAEERRKAREAKKIAKEVQAEKLKERAKQKKHEIEAVKKWRKQRQQSGFPAGGKDSELDLGFEDGKSFERSGKKRPGVSPWDRSGGKAKQAGGKGKSFNKGKKNREFRNSKFGFGGKKGLKKQNTADTTNDVRGFNGNVAGNKKRKSQAVSNNLYVFCIFNLIIVVVLMGSKNGSEMDQDYEIPVSTPSAFHKQETEVKPLQNTSEQEMNVGRVTSVHEIATEENKKGDENDCSGDNIVATDEEEEEEEEDDDELRRRVEEFIAKVNRDWRAEKLGISVSA